MSRYVGWASALCLVLVLSIVGCGSQDESRPTFSSDATDASKDVSAFAPETYDSSVEASIPAAVAESAPAPAPTAQKESFAGIFPVYTDENSPDNHYFPSGWMGDYSDVSVNTAHLDNPQSGTTCIRIKYSNKASQGARWAGIYWQNPANNWGNRPGGYDLTGSTKLTFWIRGEAGGERLEEVKVGGINGEYSDSDIAGIGPLKLTTEWKQYTIDLSGKDLSSIIGGFAWAANLDNNPDGMVFYLDNIRYE